MLVQYGLIWIYKDIHFLRLWCTVEETGFKRYLSCTMATNTQTTTAAQAGGDYIAFETSIKYDNANVNSWLSFT